MAIIMWPRELADALARTLGSALMLVGIGILASLHDPPMVLAGGLLFICGLEGVTLPDTHFWDLQFRK
jgi:uncharacterized membrane protein YkgB